MTSAGRLVVRNAKYARDFRPLMRTVIAMYAALIHARILGIL